MSNRWLKLKLYKENPLCYYCGRLMILTNIKTIPSGQTLPANAATIEHLRSRYSPYRWIKKKRGERRKVLACYECNHNRSIQETLSLSRKEILERSKGFSLSPRGKPKIIKPLKTLNEVKKVINT
jgi:hypothetical protein